MISGNMRAGKSTLARQLAKRYGGTRVGFGEAIRQRAAELGLPDGRLSWQQLGEAWVDSDPESLCNTVMASAKGQAVVILDGVRHQRILQILQTKSIGRQSMLIFVDTALEICRTRLDSDGISEEVLEQVLTHSTELEMPALRRSASLVVDGARNYAELFIVLDAIIIGGDR